MIILLTGSTGFLGSHLKKRLELGGHTVLTFPRGKIELRHYDAIINCAAELTKQDYMYFSNVDLTHYLLELAHSQGVGKFIQIGSSSEYGITNQPRRESDLCIPTNIYEATKLAATNLCLGYASAYDMDICVARPFSLYGPNDKPRKLIPTLYQSYLDHKIINIYPYSGHDWIHIDDFIDGLMVLLGADKQSTKGDIINFGTGVSSSNRELVSAIESAVNASLLINWTKTKYHDYDVENWQADISKAWVKYGWRPKYNLNSGIKEYVMVEWFKEDLG